jgi:hypothetical protein
MSDLYRRRLEVSNRRLSIVRRTAASLINELSELNELRDQVRKAQLFTRTPERSNVQRRTRILKRAASVGGRY